MSRDKGAIRAQSGGAVYEFSASGKSGGRIQRILEEGQAVDDGGPWSDIEDTVIIGVQVITGSTCESFDEKVGDVVTVFKGKIGGQICASQSEGAFSSHKDPGQTDGVSGETDDGFHGSTAGGAITDNDVGVGIQARSRWTPQLKVLVVVCATLIDAEFIDRHLGLGRNGEDGEKEQEHPC